MIHSRATPTIPRALSPGHHASAAAPRGASVATVPARCSRAVAARENNLPFDARKDLVPITEIAASQTLIVINAQVPATTLQQFIELVRRNPGQYKFASTGVGSSVHLGGQLFATREGLDMVHVPYRGEGDAIKDLVAGETQMETGVASAFLPFIRAGKLRALCVNGSRRLAVLPDVPTAAEAGLTDFELPNWYALYAPRGVPDSITQRIYQSTAKILQM
jgi:tripartite-type tricarboxylate transporter receptor subunit TctC